MNSCEYFNIIDSTYNTPSTGNVKPLGCNFKWGCHPMSRQELFTRIRTGPAPRPAIRVESLPPPIVRKAGLYTKACKPVEKNTCRETDFDKEEDPGYPGSPLGENMNDGAGKGRPEQPGNVTGREPSRRPSFRIPCQLGCSRESGRRHGQASRCAYHRATQCRRLRCRSVPR